MSRPTASVNLVLMTTDTIGGVWTYSLELIGALAKRGIEVVLATMGDPLNPEQRRAVSALDFLTVCESRFRLEWMENPWKDVKAAGDWLLKLDRIYQPDLIHLNNFAHGALPWQAPCLVVGHSCVFSWFEAVHRQAPPLAWRRYHKMVSRGLRAAERVTAPSRTMLRSMKMHYGPFTDAEPIYNCRNNSVFRPLPKKDFIFSAGRLWDEAKNIAVLERVAPFIPWPIRVAGDCRHPDGERKEFFGVEYLGRLSPREIAILMGQAAVFALPVRYEPFGLSALEAGLAGCALVLGDIPSMREIWEDAAVFVPPDDPGILQKELLRFIQHPKLRERMGRKARRRALDFAPEKMIQEYIALYKQMVSRHDARPVVSETAIEGFNSPDHDSRNHLHLVWSSKSPQ